MSQRRRSRRDDALAAEPGSAASPGDRHVRDLGLIVGIAIVLRIAYQVAFARSPFAGTLFLDAAQYDEWGRAIAAGDLVGEPRPFFVDPGYGYLLGALKALGLGHGAVRALQSVAGIVTVLVTSLLARAIAGPRAGLVAGVVAAAYLPLVFFEAMILKTTFEVLLGALVLHAAVTTVDRERRGWRWLLVGALTGLAVLFKSNFLLAAPIVLAWAVLLVARRGMRPLALTAGAFSIGFVAIVGGATVRNWVASRELVAVTYASGINFYIGNGPFADGSRSEPPFMRPVPGAEETDGNAEAVRRTGRAMSHGEISSFWWRETLRSIAAEPMRWLRVVGVKALGFLNRLEVSDNVSMAFVAESVPLLRLPLPGWWLVAPFGLAGIAWSFVVRRPGPLLLAVFAVTQAAGVVLFHVADRYRLAIVPVLVVLGTAAAMDWGRLAPRARALVLAVFVAGVVLVDVAPSPVYASGQSLANHEEMLGVAEAKAGRGKKAIAHFRRAIEKEPRRETAHYNLASALSTFGGDREEARRELRLALELEPGYAEASLLLGRLAFDAGDLEEAARRLVEAADAGQQPVPSLSSAASALGRLGRTDEAEALVRRALDLAPADAHSLEILGNVLYVGGDRAGALRAWRGSLAAAANPALAKQVEELEQSPSTP